MIRILEIHGTKEGNDSLGGLVLGTFGGTWVSSMILLCFGV
jgi:hypothetical protein